MNLLLGIDENFLKEKKSYITAKEILQQPELWKETLEIFKNTLNKKILSIRILNFKCFNTFLLSIFHICK